MGHAKVIQSGNTIEVYKYEYEIRPKRTSSRKRTSDRKAFSRRADHIHRLRKAFLRLIRSNLVGTERPALLTCTMFQVRGIKESYSEFSDFIQRCRRVFGRELRYIAVPEFQKRGAVHFHVMIWGIGHYVTKERDYRYLQNLWGQGFVDCILTDGSPKLAGYLAKYMSKAVFDNRLLSQKAYVCSRNIMRPVQVKGTAVIAYGKEIWGVELSTLTPVHERYFRSQWLGRAIYQRFEIT